MSRQHYIATALSTLLLVAIPLEQYLGQLPSFFLEEFEVEKIESTYLDGEGDEFKKSSGGHLFGTPVKYTYDWCRRITLLSKAYSFSNIFGSGKRVPLYILFGRLKVDPRLI